MKKILVPTDFSTCATYAADFAINLAAKLSSTVHFFSRLNIHPLWHQLSEEQRKDYPESLQRIEKAQKSFQVLKESYYLSQIPIETSFYAGDILQNVLRIIQTQKIELIVMGSSGASGIKEILFGSNAQKIVKYAPVHTIVVKHPVESEQRELKNIIFVSDFQEPAKKPFEELINFATAFGSHIHLLYVDLAPSDQTENTQHLKRMETFDKMCWRLPTTLHKVGDIGLEAGITHFAHKQRADLVAVARYGKTPLKRILTGSVTEALVNHLDIPVMVLKEPVQEEITAK